MEFKRWELVEVKNYSDEDWEIRPYITKIEWMFNPYVVVAEWDEDEFKNWENFEIENFEEIREINKRPTLFGNIVIDEIFDDVKELNNKMDDIQDQLRVIEDICDDFNNVLYKIEDKLDNI